jgi:phosphatidate cytidylyltransferase
MHLKRWLTGIIALPVLIYIIGFCPRWIFYLLLYLASLAGLTEFYRITTPDLHKIGKWAGHLLSLLLFLSIYKGKIYFLPAVIALWAFVPMTLFMLIPPSQGRQSTGDLGKALLGPVYVSLPLGMLMIMDRYPQGNIWIFFLLSVIFAGDTGAFYSGKLFGKHKLYESISPKKTWEGAIGGLLCCIVAAFWFLRILRIHQVDLGILALVIVLSVTGQIGDLAESMLKRSSGVKDSSQLLPGHGGILDRIDSLLFAIPVLYMYLHLCIV